MAILDLSSVPQVVLDFMNDDHATATALTNQLHDKIKNAANNDSDTAEITIILADLYQHNAEHFSREEEQMRNAHFPPYDCHKGEHERVLAQMRDVLQAWQDKPDLQQLEQYLTDTMVPWFIQHINTMDTVTAMFITRQSA